MPGRTCKVGRYRLNGKVAEIAVEPVGNDHVTVKRGDSLKICLSERAGTGYRWSRAGELPGHVVEHPVTREARGTGVGGATRVCFHYLCEAEGTAELRFVLRRPWLPDKIEKEVRLTLQCAA
jgi:hypothetical protein